jgi:hypothetical protein
MECPTARSFICSAPLHVASYGVPHCTWLHMHCPTARGFICIAPLHVDSYGVSHCARSFIWSAPLHVASYALPQCARSFICTASLCHFLLTFYFASLRPKYFPVFPTLDDINPCFLFFFKITPVKLPHNLNNLRKFCFPL